MANKILNPFSYMQPLDSGSEQIVSAKPAALDEAVEKAYIVYEGFGIPTYFSQMSSLEKQILSPSQIDNLLHVIKSTAEPERLIYRATGYYLSKLIQDSYNAGNNNFVLTTGDKSINSIGYHLMGKKDRMLNLCIEGSAGNNCGSYVKYIELNVSGNAGSQFAHYAQNSKLDILGKVSNMGLDAYQTLFVAHNEQTYNTLNEYIDTRRVGKIRQRYAKKRNKIQLVNSKGKIVMEKHL